MPPKINQDGMVFPTRQEFLDSCLSQTLLSFRKPVIDYIFKFPTSSKLYQKLIQCCKFFFLKNSILVIRALNSQTPYFGGTSTWKYCPAVECTYFCNHKPLEREKLACKIWITERLTVGDNYNNKGIKELLTKLYKCDATDLDFHDVDIGYADLKAISSNVEGCYLKYGCVSDENGERIPLEDLLEIFSPAIKVTVNRISNNFVKDYKKLVDVCSTIQINELYRLDDEFDVDLFVDLLEESNCQSVIYYERSIDDRIATWRPVKYYYEEEDDDEEEFSDEEEYEETCGEDDEEEVDKSVAEDFNDNKSAFEIGDGSSSGDSSSDENETSKITISKKFCNLFSCFSKAKRH